MIMRSSPNVLRYVLGLIVASAEEHGVVYAFDYFVTPILKSMKTIN